MASPKRVKRNVIGMSRSRELTKQKNPTHYWYVLDCGHVALEHHKASVHLDYMFTNEKESTVQITKYCHKCQYSMPIKPDLLINVLGFFTGDELNDKIIDMYKKYAPQVAPKLQDEKNVE